MAESSYFARFMHKFFEISVAGMATAASGFLIAHIGGFFSNQTPAPVQPVSLPPTIIQPADLPPSNVPPANLPPSNLPPSSVQPASVPPAAAPAAAVKPAASAPGPERAVSAPVTGAPVPLPQAKAEPARPSAPPAAPTPSLESQVRAALAKSGKDTAKENAKGAPRAPADAGGPMIAATPRDAAPAPPPQAATIAPPPAAPIEIKSVPVVGEDAAAAPPPAATQGSAQADAPAHGNGLISAIKNFPDYLRTDTGALPADQAPRPPAPVGQ